MVIGPTAPVGSAESVLVTGAVQLDAANNLTVVVVIQSSSDGGATWNDASIPLTFRTKVTPNNPPRCVGYALVHHLEAGSAGARLYRLAFQTAGVGTVTFNNGTIYVEDFAK